MARTKASVGAKVSSGKSSKARCSAAPPNANFGTVGREKSARSSGGNPVCPRDTPKWQKPITTFFVTNHIRESDSVENDDADGSSKSKPKRNAIYSDDEDTSDKEGDEKPTNSALDETLVLEPLTGDNSHKIEEYYETKGKGKGKKSNKKNMGDGKQSSSKRDLEEVEESQANKKRKVA